MQVTERFIELDTYRARVLEAGEGTPTLCLHGVNFTNSAELWLQPMRAGLARKARLIAIDNLGWGPGPRPEWDPNFSFFVDHMRQVQDALGYQRTDVIGHSFGGWLASLLAYESPERVGKLVLSDSGGMSPVAPDNVSQFEPPTREGLRQYLEGIYSEPADVAEQLEYQWRNATSPQAVDYFRRMSRTLQDPVVRRHYHLARRLPKIKAATLVIFGADAPAPFTAEVGRRMAATIPDARFVAIAGAGHLTPYQKTQEYVREVAAFLAD